MWTDNAAAYPKQVMDAIALAAEPLRRRWQAHQELASPPPASDAAAPTFESPAANAVMLNDVSRRPPARVIGPGRSALYSQRDVTLVLSANQESATATAYAFAAKVTAAGFVFGSIELGDEVDNIIGHEPTARAVRLLGNAICVDLSCRIVLIECPPSFS